jgi:hypothetical protein
MKKFDTLVEEVEKSLISEAPDYHENAVLAKEHTAEDSEDAAKAKKVGKKLEDFDGLETYLLEKNLGGRTRRYTFYFFKNNKCQCVINIDHIKIINPPTSIGKQPHGTTDEFILYTADQRKEDQNLGLARKIVLNYFSKLFPSLISGEDANRLGRPFWKKLLVGALEKGFEVKGSLNKEEHDYKPENFEKYWLSDKIDDPLELSHNSDKTLARRKYFRIIFPRVA